MFRKIICVFILFSFLLVKNTSLYMVLKHLPDSSICQEDVADDDLSGNEKENKELKSFDDFIHQPILRLVVFFNSRNLSSAPVLRMTTPYFSKLYTPPDVAS